MEIVDILRLIRKKAYALRAPFFLADDKRFRKYAIGEFTYGAPTVLTETAGATLTVGRYCSIAEGVKIHLAGMHPIDRVSTYPFDDVLGKSPEFDAYARSKGDVIIGHDVWIGTETLILSGVRIGNGAVIGARSVVTKDVPPYSVVAGNPAQHIRYRFDQDTIAALEKIAWWDWSRTKVEEVWPALLSSDVKGFIAKYGK